MAESTGPRLTSFLGWVGLVSTALKIKESHQYSHVDADDEHLVGESRLYMDEEDIGLLNPETVSDRSRPKRVKRSGCCVCCGINCSLFWKAFGLVLLVTGGWYAVKLLLWAVNPAPTGLEHMPVYSTSLGCLSASHVYQGGKVTVSVPSGNRHDHAIDVHGGSPGTIFVTEGPADSTDIQYDVLIKSNNEELLSQVGLFYPTDTENANSQLLLSTPLSSEESCLRYDIVMRVPPSLKKLHVASHTAAHVQFDPNSRLSFDNLFVTLYSIRNNMILPHENVHAGHLSLEVYRGWIVGDVAIVNSTSILTQRGDGVANVRVHPIPNLAGPAHFQTTTGAGRTDVFYVSDHSAPHSPIRNQHVSSMNANVYLTYEHSDFSGQIALNSRSFSATGLTAFDAEDDVDAQWTHWVGDKEGEDTISVKSRGWTGLYF